MRTRVHTTLETVGFEPGVSKPVLFRYERLDACIVVHGSDDRGS